MIPHAVHYEPRQLAIRHARDLLERTAGPEEQPGANRLVHPRERDIRVRPLQGLW